MSKLKSPSVLAFEKKLVPSDALFYSLNWEQRDVEGRPLPLREKTVRGTISNRFKAKEQTKFAKNPLALDAEVSKANIQTVDECALPMEHDTLLVRFSLKVLGGIHKPAACNDMEYLDHYQTTVADYIKQEGFRALAERYAINLANARFLWRNRVGADEIQVRVKNLLTDETAWEFDAKQFSLEDFPTAETSVDSLASSIASALSSTDDFLLLQVDCFAKLGQGQAVYPSEEFIMDKGKGKKSKVLYHVNDIAAMHSQKIGNAIRCIDTWYPDHLDFGKTIGPIAVEPYGAVTTRGKAFRSPGNGNKDFYNLFDQWIARREALSSLEDQHYVMAVLVRGGVFGESSKEQ